MQARNTRVATVLRMTAPTPLPPPAPRAGALPPRSVVVTGSARIADGIADRARARGALLVCTDPAAAPDGPALRLVGPPDAPSSAAAVQDFLDEAAKRPPHLRVLVSIDEVAGQWPDAVPQQLTTTQELLLLLVKRLSSAMDGGSVGVVVLDAQVGGMAHPYGALFTGMLRSLAWELPRTRVTALVTDARPTDALTQLAEELGSVPDWPVVYHSGAQRLTEFLVPAPLSAPSEAASTLVDSSSVLLATGGARGITAASLLGLAHRFAPSIWLMGTTPVDGVPDEYADASDEEEARLRPAFISSGLRVRPGASVGELNRRFTALWRARTIVRTLRELRAACGKDRVHYLVCDLGDRQATGRAVDRVFAAEGRVDLLVHAANSSRSAPVATKSLDDYRAVLGAKSDGYLNLQHAFRGRPPGTWCNFGSVGITFGMAGETDYVAANELLAAAARFNSEVLGRREFTVGWGLWEESGFASGLLERERVRRLGLLTGMTDAEGVAAFIDELTLPRSPEAAPMWASPAERDLARQAAPGTASLALPTVSGGGVLLDAPDTSSPGSAQWTYTVDPVRDRHLADHSLDGRPMLAGMTMLALAAEAAGVLLAPGTAVSGFRDLVFSEFVWADPDRPGPTKYRVRAVRFDAGRVRVVIQSDILSPSGRLLREDREHARIDVLTGTRPPAPAAPKEPSDPEGGIRYLDPAHGPSSPLRLSGPFRTLSDISTGPSGARATWLARVGADELFARLPLPVLLLDGLVRTGFFVPADPDKVRIRVLRSIGAVDLYAWGSDHETAALHRGGVHVHCDAATGTCTAAADGKVLARLTDVDAPPYATVPAQTLRRLP
ncbi:SDR family oxidoreductase [Streptomyces griseus]|uniref:SDR family oxidoreductase n=1 Tax=Streptomyces griseus TaxID=1911 RepID=UPI0004C8DCE3|nr:SDR family oxidoreductase [Streptomyces griseus]